MATYVSRFTKYDKNMFWKTQLSFLHAFTTLLTPRQRVPCAMTTVVLLLVMLVVHSYETREIFAQSSLQETYRYRDCRQVKEYFDFIVSYVIPLKYVYNYFEISLILFI